MCTSTWTLARHCAPHPYLFIRLFNLGKIVEIVLHGDADDVYSTRTRQPLLGHQLTEMLLRSEEHRKHHLDSVPKSLHQEGSVAEPTS